jgi:DNA-binding XRE family transcriptional regulator
LRRARGAEQQGRWANVARRRRAGLAPGGAFLGLFLGEWSFNCSGFCKPFQNGTDKRRLSGAIFVMSTTLDERLGKRLLQRRRALGLTQHRLASAVGIRFQQIQKYECGMNKMSAARIWALANALDVPITYFFEGIDPELPKLADASKAA